MSDKMIEMNKLMNSLKCTEEDFKSYEKVQKLILLEDIQTYLENSDDYNEFDLLCIDSNIEKIVHKLDDMIGYYNECIADLIYDAIKFYIK